MSSGWGMGALLNRSLSASLCSVSSTHPAKYIEKREVADTTDQSKGSKLGHNY